MSDAAGKTAAERLATPVQFLKGVGPARAELLARLGLRTAADVLFYFPRDYEDMSALRSIDSLVENEAVSICGVIDEVDLRDTGSGRSLLGALIRQESQYLRALWFNQPYMRERLPRGRRVMLSGTARMNGGRWEMTHPKVVLLDDDEEPATGAILPVYSLTEGINQSQMRRVVQLAVENCADAVVEVLPDSLLAEHSLAPIHAALQQIHKPQSAEQLQIARRRFVFQELLVLQLALALRRQRLDRLSRAPVLEATAKIDSRIVGLFEFELTGDQRQAIDEVAADMARPHPMNRLLHGEVGSGKTVVAQYAMLLAVAQGYQAVIMTPTEVLARQHARTFAEQLRHGRVRIGLLTGTLTAAERRERLAAIAAGEVDLVIGTHAVISDDVHFHNLGLVVIDEQHRFGVKQRAALKYAGADPHYLVMTATPIPRTMAMTLFGDFDVSTLKSPPPGRQPVHTYLGDAERRTRWWEFYRKKLREGRQGYVIAPLVEEAEESDTASVQQMFEALANGELEEFRVDLVHGRLHWEEKDAAMRRFADGTTQVLVATSVVEVGVDVPNATLMTIEGGERFGLAQLHQLRGRVSRGAHPGYVCVFADPKTEAATKRLDAFVATTDGFELAEVDFQLRGPGDLFGVRQHGLPPLRIADLQRDVELLAEARSAAQSLIAADAELAAPEFAKLRRQTIVRYGDALDLGDVG